MASKYYISKSSVNIILTEISLECVQETCTIFLLFYFLLKGSIKKITIGAIKIDQLNYLQLSFLSRLSLTNCLVVMPLILGGWQRSKRPPVKTLHPWAGCPVICLCTPIDE